MNNITGARVPRMGWFVAACLVWMFAGPLSAMADEAADVQALAKRKITIVVDLIRDKSLSTEERHRRILEAVEPVFDFDQMARLSLGKKHWVELDKKTQAEYLQLFNARLKESYLEKLDLYTDEQVVVEDAAQVRNRIHVLTHLVTKQDRKEMVYKFYKTDTGWKVYDVVILGVSVVQIYRSQFNELLARGSLDDLMAKLRVKGEITINEKK